MIISESETGASGFLNVSSATTGVRGFSGEIGSGCADLYPVRKVRLSRFSSSSPTIHPLQTANAIHSRTVWRDVGRRSSWFYYFNLSQIGRGIVFFVGGKKWGFYNYSIPCDPWVPVERFGCTFWKPSKWNDLVIHYNPRFIAHFHRIERTCSYDCGSLCAPRVSSLRSDLRGNYPITPVLFILWMN